MVHGADWGVKRKQAGATLLCLAAETVDAGLVLFLAVIGCEEPSVWRQMKNLSGNPFV